ncbi:hypothetical protein [Microbacterium aurantiacum]|uniref:hypothetical protein n=1 Tax=Microbacterium aurantiacum TaxID=162393 RepID=UPI004035CCDF
MLTALTAAGNRVFAGLGRISMYRTAFFALAALALISLALSLWGLVSPTAAEIVVSAAVLGLAWGGGGGGARRRRARAGRPAHVGCWVCRGAWSRR